MFSKAYDLARQFTQPLVVNMRFFDKTIESGLGSFVILNKDGWCMTAAHNFGVAFAFNQHQIELKEYNEKVEKINANKQMKPAQLEAAKRSIKPNKKWITDFNILLGTSPIPVVEYYIYGEHDLALFKVDPAAITAEQIFPKIKNASNIKYGTSLCKYGFPFIEFKSTFDTTTNQFVVPSNLFPVAAFPIEGIYTRDLKNGKEQEGIEVMFLETSSPGLKGQSGGPIFDIEGNIYAIQSQNSTMPLGFKGIVEINGKKIEENQFLNVGLGIHTKTLEFFLDKHGIEYEKTD